jgi:hypothetical protein
MRAPKGPAYFDEIERRRGPYSGVPRDLFPNGGVPLYGELTPEQEAWLRGVKTGLPERPGTRRSTR